MSKRKRIGLRDVRALKPGEIIWDAAVPGFAARRQKGTAVAYILKYRTGGGRQRWQTIGRHGAPWTPDTARAKAQELLGEVAKDRDPAAEKRAQRKATTVAELCDMYLAEALAGRVLKRRGAAKKASTLEIDKGRIERHIKPLLGKYAVAAVTRHDVERFLHDIAEGKTNARIRTKTRGLARVTGGKTAANRSVGLLGGMFTYAVRHGLRPENPVHGLQRFEDAKRERRLTYEEYATLGAALRKGPDAHIWPGALAAVWFLAVTGWRRSEALGLRWSEIDLVRRTAILGDTKTGRSLRPLSRAACDVLQAMAQLRSGGGVLVFPATRGEGTIAGFRKFWLRIARLGGLPAEITPHVLRHSFASLAADLGYSEPTIAALVGHAGRSITSRYVHAADAVLLAAADAVADKTAELMGEGKPAGDGDADVPTRMPSHQNRGIGQLLGFLRADSRQAIRGGSPARSTPPMQHS
jgi:integrase